MRIRLQDGLYESLVAGDLPGLIAIIKRLFASIPWRNFTGNAFPDADTESAEGSLPAKCLSKCDCRTTTTRSAARPP